MRVVEDGAKQVEPGVERSVGKVNKKDRVRVHVPVIVVSSLFVVGKRREVGRVRDYDVRRLRERTKSNRHLDVTDRGRREGAEQLERERIQESLANVNDMVEETSQRGRGRAC